MFLILFTQNGRGGAAGSAAKKYALMPARQQVDGGNTRNHT
jgi:hypothetical protein